MKPRALVAVEIQQRRWIIGALALQVVGIRSSRRDWRHERVDSFNRVIEQQPPLCDHVMAAARAAAQQFHEVETLANYTFVGVEAVIRNNDEHGFRSHLAFFDSRPDSAQQCVQLTQHLQM